MRVLLVSNQHPNERGVGNPIMYRMLNAMKRDGRIGDVDFEPAFNSLSSMFSLRKKAKNYDIVHIHFGGLYALIIWFFLLGVNNKKFITFHGTDIHAKALKTANSAMERVKILMNQKASFLCICLFDKCGFVAQEMMEYVPKCLQEKLSTKAFVQPLGVDYSVFLPTDKNEALSHLGLQKGHYVLFSDVSNTSIKRRDIAEAIVKELGEPYQLLIMSGVKPAEVPYYINACDLALLTSDEEGSPNIIREALSLNKPFFSVNVGDAERQLTGLNCSAIISRNPKEAAATIKTCLNKSYTDNTRESRKNFLDFNCINNAVISLYKEMLQ